jgi:hypothetical protein
VPWESFYTLTHSIALITFIATMSNESCKPTVSFIDIVLSYCVWMILVLELTCLFCTELIIYFKYRYYDCLFFIFLFILSYLISCCFMLFYVIQILYKLWHVLYPVGCWPRLLDQLNKIINNSNNIYCWMTQKWLSVSGAAEGAESRSSKGLSELQTSLRI